MEEGKNIKVEEKDPFVDALNTVQYYLENHKIDDENLASSLKTVFPAMQQAVTGKRPNYLMHVVEEEDSFSEGECCDCYIEFDKFLSHEEAMIFSDILDENRPDFDFNPYGYVDLCDLYPLSFEALIQEVLGYFEEETGIHGHIVTYDCDTEARW